MKYQSSNPARLEEKFISRKGIPTPFEFFDVLSDEKLLASPFFLALGDFFEFLLVYFGTVDPTIPDLLQCALAILAAVWFLFWILFENFVSAKA